MRHILASGLRCPNVSSRHYHFCHLSVHPHNGIFNTKVTVFIVLGRNQYEITVFFLLLAYDCGQFRRLRCNFFLWLIFLFPFSITNNGN
jgi:hypothetical protein